MQTTALTLALGLGAQAAQGANWTAPHTPAENTVALFHFDRGSSASLPATVRTGVAAGTLISYQRNHASLDATQNLEHYNFNDPLVGSMAFSEDVAVPSFGAASLALTGNVRFRGAGIYNNANLEHTTIESWVKWDDINTSSDLRLGTGDRALRIIRDKANPTKDGIGFQGSHSVWRPHPGFTSFAALANPVTDGEWFHVAMVIHNAEMHDHGGHWHYEDGSFAMIFVNGRLVGEGTAADRIDLADEELVFHSSDRLALWQTEGTSRVLIDEFVVEQSDLTDGGTVLAGLFENGRGGTESNLTWTMENFAAPDMVALYHFDAESSVPREATVRTGVPAGTLVNHQLNELTLGQGQALEHYNFNDALRGDIDFSADVATGPFGMSALAMNGPVRYRGKDIFADANQEHFTVEAWVKWDDYNTSSNLLLGSGDRGLRIIRDADNPLKDAIGFQGSHSVWRPSVAFSGWDSLENPVTDGQWFHVAMVIHNAGMHEEAGHWHFDAGSFAMFFVDGELVGKGTPNDRVDLSDEELVFHGSDRLALWQTAGTSRILIDELTVWQRDFTSGGTVVDGLFQDGRGGTSSVENWMLFD